MNIDPIKFNQIMAALRSKEAQLNSEKNRLARQSGVFAAQIQRLKESITNNLEFILTAHLPQEVVLEEDQPKRPANPMLLAGLGAVKLRKAENLPVKKTADSAGSLDVSDQSTSASGSAENSDDDKQPVSLEKIWGAKVSGAPLPKATKTKEQAIHDKVNTINVLLAEVGVLKSKTGPQVLNDEISMLKKTQEYLENVSAKVRANSKTIEELEQKLLPFMIKAKPVPKPKKNKMGFDLMNAITGSGISSLTKAQANNSDGLKRREEERLRAEHKDALARKTKLRRLNVDYATDARFKSIVDAYILQQKLENFAAIIANNAHLQAVLQKSNEYQKQIEEEEKIARAQAEEQATKLAAARQLAEEVKYTAVLKDNHIVFNKADKQQVIDQIRLDLAAIIADVTNKLPKANSVNAALENAVEVKQRQLQRLAAVQDVANNQPEALKSEPAATVTKHGDLSLTKKETLVVSKAAQHVNRSRTTDITMIAIMEFNKMVQDLINYAGNIMTAANNIRVLPGYAKSQRRIAELEDMVSKIRAISNSLAHKRPFKGAAVTGRDIMALVSITEKLRGLLAQVENLYRSFGGNVYKNFLNETSGWIGTIINHLVRLVDTVAIMLGATQQPELDSKILKELNHLKQTNFHKSKL